MVAIPEDVFFGGLNGKTLALALITPWNTDGKVASEETVFMTSRKASVITDIRSVQAIVGLVETRKRWGVIERMLGGAATSFVDADIKQGSESDSDDESMV